MTWVNMSPLETDRYRISAPAKMQSMYIHTSWIVSKSWCEGRFMRCASRSHTAVSPITPLTHQPVVLADVMQLPFHNNDPVSALQLTSECSAGLSSLGDHLASAITYHWWLENTYLDLDCPSSLTT